MQVTEGNKPEMAPVVHIVDDDAGVRASLMDLLGAAGYLTQPFASAADVLAGLDTLCPGVFLIDMRLGGTTGLDLITELAHRDCLWPAAIITAHADIRLAVESMKVGAFDFLEKPFAGATLRKVVDAGLAMLPERVEKSRRRRTSRQLIAALSPRERQVFEGVVEGLTNKEIAIRHGLSHRTVESYRIGMASKLGMQNKADLFELKAVLSDMARDHARA